jgi:predicted negative regulator of RcsB-dependent stress response
MKPSTETRVQVRTLAARLRTLIAASGPSSINAVTFIDEDGESNTLAMEFATATMGHILLGQGRRDEARAVFEAVLARDAHDESARLGMTLLREE